MVQVFQAGKYEDLIPNNAIWTEGDWDTDGDFTSSDMVIAFQSGTYEIGPPNAQVPEPASLLIFVIGVCCYLLCGNRKTLRYECQCRDSKIVPCLQKRRS